jgi:L-rhamnose mutarotase
MKRYAIVMNMKPGMKEEYKRRHDALWPEMRDLLAECGFANYSIWNAGEQLFQYFEIEDLARAARILKRSDVKKRWDEYMKDIIDEAHAVDMEEMFYFNADQ